MTEIHIKLNRIKLLLLLFGAVGFTIISVMFIYRPEWFTSFLFFSIKIIRLIGFIGLFFFGIASIFIIPKLFDNTSGLVINNVGIIDNSTASPVGLILWDDITKIEVKKINSINILLIFLKNPTDYISKANWINRFGLNNNMKTYGTPVTITSLGMKCSFKELTKLILTNYELNKNRKE